MIYPDLNAAGRFWHETMQEVKIEIATNIRKLRGSEPLMEPFLSQFVG
jgi:hypothetical protein